MGEAQDNLLRLASVAGYKRTSKNGKTVFVRAYTSTVRAAVDKFEREMKQAGGPVGSRDNGGWFTEDEARSFAQRNNVHPEKFLSLVRKRGQVNEKNFAAKKWAPPAKANTPGAAGSADEALVNGLKKAQVDAKRAKDAKQSAALDTAMKPKPGWNARSSQGGTNHVDDPIVADHDPTLHRKTVGKFNPAAQPGLGPDSPTPGMGGAKGPKAKSLTERTLEYNAASEAAGRAVTRSAPNASELHLKAKDLAEKMGLTDQVAYHTREAKRWDFLAKRDKHDAVADGIAGDAPEMTVTKTLNPGAPASKGGFKYKPPVPMHKKLFHMSVGPGPAQSKLLRLAGLETPDEGAE